MIDAAGCAILLAGWEMVDAGCEMVDAGWEMVAAGCEMVEVGWEMVVAWDWMIVVLGGRPTTGNRRGNVLWTPILCGSPAISAAEIGAAATSKPSIQRCRRRGRGVEDSDVFTGL